ncbi:hypothetical protein LTR94_024042 [Friedmanniomyces endolithicus]|nr:hypothetical protein LTR94_024042 [Friedmanniomyces endolithicus]
MAWPSPDRRFEGSKDDDPRNPRKLAQCRGAGHGSAVRGAGRPLPDRLRVAIGFTSRGAKGKAIAHAPDAMPAQIAAILAHELVHAAVGIPAGHGKAFKRVALGLGLVGPMRATTPGEAFLAAVAPILDAAGPLPHARLDTDGESTAPKEQKTRMLKCECATCGYTARTARKWLEQAGAPLCPIEDHGQMSHEALDDDSEDEGGEDG